MCRRLSPTTMSSRISIPINWENSSASIKSTRNALQAFYPTRRRSFGSRPAQFSKFVLPKGRRNRDPHRFLSAGLFCDRQPRPRGSRRGRLVLFALGGDSYPHSGVAFTEGETTPSQAAAFERHLSNTQRNHARNRERRFRARERRRLGLGRLPPILSPLLQSRRSRPGDYLPQRATRSLVLLPANLVPVPDRRHLDDVELPALVWVETDAAISHQPPAA